MIMAEPSQNDATPGKRLSWLPLAIGVFVLAVFVTAAWYFTSPQFHAYVRARVVAELETTTGGRVDMQALRWNVSRLTFEVDDLTIHGLEQPNEVPYVHVDKLSGRVKINSLWRQDVSLASLDLQHPVVHLISYPDGTTNQPRPKSRPNSSPVDDVLRLAIGRAQAHQGVFLLNERAIPFEFNASDVQADMTFARADQRYDASVHVAKLDAKFKDARPVAAILDAQVSLFAKRVQVRSVKVSTGRSQLEATGVIDDFNDPKLTLSYKVGLSLSELGGIIRDTRVHAGTLDLTGQGTYHATSFNTSGVLAINRLAYSDENVQVSNFAATADFSADRSNFELTKIAAHAFGGNVTGSASVRNWLNGGVPPASASTHAASSQQDRTRAASSQQGSAHLKLADLSVAELAPAVSSKQLPLAKMNLAGLASGDVDAKWIGSIKNAVANVAIEVVPPAQLLAGQLPLTAHARASAAPGSGRLELTELSAQTRATHLTASGVLALRNSNLKLSASTTDMGEFKPLLATLKPGKLPVDVHGSASFTGTASGTLKSPTIAGHLDIRDFDSLLVTTPLVPANAAPTARPNRALRKASAPSAPTKLPAPPKITRMHWDSFATDIQYSPTQVSARNGVLHRGTAELAFDGSTALTKGDFTDHSPFSARVNLRNANLADVQSLAGTQYPVTGIINLTAEISGTQLDPRGQGKLTVTNASAYGESIRQITSNIRFANQEAQLTNIDLAHNGSHVTGSVAYNLTSKAFRFDLASQAIDLAGIHELHTRIPLRGLLSFTAQGSGTAEAPAINAHLRLSNIFSGAERVGDIVADAVTTGDTMKVTARSNFQNSDLRLDGTVRLRSDFPAQLSLQARQVDIDPLLRAYIKGEITAHSRLAGSAEARGPLKHPRLMTVKGNIQQFAAEVEHIGIHNDGPIEFAMNNQVATITRARLVGDNTELAANGTVELAGDKRIDIHADGRINMRLIRSYNPAFRSEGTIVVSARAAGTVTQPSMFGTLKIQNGSISYVDLPNGLSNINGTLAFNQDRLQIQQLTAKTGGGTLNLGGFVTYGKMPTFNITATAKDMRLRYPPGVSSMADADLRLTGSTRGALLSGDITVNRFGVNPQFDLAYYVAKAKQAPIAPDPNSILNNLRLDVHITSAPELQVQTSLGKISGNADLRVRGSGTRPSVLGRVSIIEGDVFFTGTKYHIERGDITFNNPVRIEPVIDVEATTTVRSYDITLGFHGRMDALSITYRSDPPLSSNDIIQLLAFGRTQTEMEQQTTVQQNTFPESASDQILSQALNLALSSRVQRLFGITRVKIDPTIGGTENNPSGAKITVEQQVANNFTVTYITDVTRSTQQVIQVEYNINHNLSVSAVRDQNGVLSVDIRLRQRKR